MQQRAYSSSKPLKQLLRSCRDGGIPSHPVDSGEFKRLPGWDHQLTMCNTEYFNVTWNKNGSELYTGSAPADYSTSIIGNVASSNSRQPSHAVLTPSVAANSDGAILARRRGGNGWREALSRRRRRPSAPQPHDAGALVSVSISRSSSPSPPPVTPCLLCADAESIPGLQAPRTPAYNHSAVGHVPFIAEEPPLSVADEVRLDKQFNDRWRTLLSVDDLVGAVVGALESTGLAKNTCTGPATFFLHVLFYLAASLTK